MNMDNIIRWLPVVALVIVILIIGFSANANRNNTEMQQEELCVKYCESNDMAYFNHVNYKCWCAELYTNVIMHGY